jgi:hypothetical protein
MYSLKICVKIEKKPSQKFLDNKGVTYSKAYRQVMLYLKLGGRPYMQGKRKKLVPLFFLSRKKNISPSVSSLPLSPIRTLT